MGHKGPKSQIGHQCRKSTIGHWCLKCKIGHQCSRCKIGHLGPQSKIGYQGPKCKIGHMGPLSKIGYQGPKCKIVHGMHISSYIDITDVTIFPSLTLSISFRRRANARNVSLWWPTCVINAFDNAELPCYIPHRRSTTISLETLPF